MCIKNNCKLPKESLTRFICIPSLILTPVARYQSVANSQFSNNLNIFTSHTFFGRSLIFVRMDICSMVSTNRIIADMLRIANVVSAHTTCAGDAVVTFFFSIYVFFATVRISISSIVSSSGIRVIWVSASIRSTTFGASLATAVAIYDTDRFTSPTITAFVAG